MNWKAKLARAFFLLVLVLVSMFGAAWRISVTQAQQFPDSQLELRADGAPEIGQPYIVDIYANIAAPAYGFGVQLQYDPAVLQLDLQQELDQSMVPLRVGGVFLGAQRIRNNQEAQGELAIVDAVYTLLPPAEPVQGEGFIGRVTFTVLQDAPAQVELVSPRLIALQEGTAMDMPLVVGEPLLLNEGAAPVVDTPITVEAPQPAVAAVQNVSAVPAQPLVESIVTTVDTPRDVLDQMARTSALMNAVTIGLLVMMGLLMAVMMISTFFDALATMRAQGVVPQRAYAYAQNPNRTVMDSYRADGSSKPREEGYVVPDRTIPSRSMNMRRMMALPSYRSRDEK